MKLVPHSMQFLANLAARSSASRFNRCAVLCFPAQAFEQNRCASLVDRFRRWKGSVHCSQVSIGRRLAASSHPRQRLAVAHFSPPQAHRSFVI